MTLLTASTPRSTRRSRQALTGADTPPPAARARSKSRSRSKTPSKQAKTPSKQATATTFTPPKYSEILKLLISPSSNWIIYDNNGSMGGFFDFVPEHLRVGPWFPLSPPFILAYIYVMFAYTPTLSFAPTTAFPALFSTHHIVAIVTSLNGLYVLQSILKLAGPGVLFTYTITSWCILTYFALSSAVCSFFTDHGSGVLYLLAASHEFFRFPALVAASVTFVLWNFLLAPIMYFFFMKTVEKKATFITWNLQFHMAEIHVLNYPISVALTIVSSSSRLLTSVDLWAAFAVMLYYSLLYLLILDRLGVHLYPVFSPRSKFCVVGWSAVFLIYYFTYTFWNFVLGAGGVSFYTLTGGVGHGIMTLKDLVVEQKFVL